MHLGNRGCYPLQLPLSKEGSLNQGPSKGRFFYLPLRDVLMPFRILVWLLSWGIFYGFYVFLSLLKKGTHRGNVGRKL